ncbi:MULTISPECIES: DUF7113 family protein [Halomicrobium]|uniref:Uncharacterized protein n=2 Tax=Halomicrobium mukohataei TaxID=57705 RepID=C7P3U8_HALMD|nr:MULTISPECIES: hypothetical protein [Halomicrobium]ACV47770.1 conserved hypothetical protein [Halomicrobium mukohataei DSM 12286]QCD66221.1 hypothetical protein E5139_11405 [Halomicrobium mukohataei]QFR21026.1 hypothetical protein GBQ70_11400 [Halomicrobium sp. ZPS1]
MLLVHGAAGGTALTGTIYEDGEDAPEFAGSPDDDAPYVWICDEFYEVDTGGSTQTIGGEEIQIAFESPMPRGFQDREQALDAAKDHVRTQFVRLGIDADEVEITVTRESDPEHAE